jgi:hypothetical protein
MESKEDDIDVEVEIEPEPGGREKVVVSMEELERGLKKMFGGWALDTRIEKKRDRIVVNGDGWQFVFEIDGELIFKPDSAAYRLVRSVDDLERVGSDEGDEEGAVTFVFPEEKITLRQGVEHRA